MGRRVTKRGEEIQGPLCHTSQRGWALVLRAPGSRGEMRSNEFGRRAQADLARTSVAQGGQEEGTWKLSLEGLAGRVSQRWEQHSVQRCWSSKCDLGWGQAMAGPRCQAQGPGSVQGVLRSHGRAVSRGGAGQPGGPVGVGWRGRLEAEARGEAEAEAWAMGKGRRGHGRVVGQEDRAGDLTSCGGRAGEEAMTPTHWPHLDPCHPLFRSPFAQPTPPIHKTGLSGRAPL